MLEFYTGDRLAGSALVPFGQIVDLGGGLSSLPGRYAVQRHPYRYDPGIPLVGFGAFVLLAGLIISFYLLPARLFVRLDGRRARPPRRWAVGLAATTVKGYDIFEAQFARSGVVA